MPRPKAEKKAYKPVIENPENTRYDGFLDDMNRLLELCNNSGLLEKINAAIGELENKINSMNGEELRPQRESLEKVKDQLLAYGTYINDFKTQFNGNSNGLYYMTNADKHRGRIWGDEGVINVSFEGGYGQYMNAFDDWVSRGQDLFVRNGEVKKIKADADAYNLASGYSDYQDTNSLMYRIDDIFNGVTRFFTELERMSALNKKYRKETELERELNVEKVNLEQYGKLLVNQPDFSITTWKTQLVTAMIATNDSKKELDGAVIEKNTADEKLRRLQRELSEIKDQKMLAEESRERNKAEYERAKSALDEYTTCEPVLNKAFATEFPPLEGFFEARDRKVEDYKTRSHGEMVGKLTDAFQMDEWMLKENMEGIGKRIGDAIKNSPDKRLKGFYDKETLKYQYTQYPRAARTLVRLISEIPYEMRGLISPETRGITPVRIDLQKLYEKNLDPEKSKWEDKEKPTDIRLLKRVLNLAEAVEKLCPPEYRSFDLSEDTLKKIEEQGMTMLAKSANDEIYFLIDQIREKEKELDKALAEEKRAENHKTELENAKAERKKRKEKAGADEKKNIDAATLEYKNAVNRRKEKQAEIDRIRENENYITGATSVSIHIGNHINAQQEYFDVNVRQAEMLLGLYKDEKKETAEKRSAVFSEWNNVLAAMEKPLVSLAKLKGMPASFYRELKKIADSYKEFTELETDKDKQKVLDKYAGYQQKLKDLEKQFGTDYKKKAEEQVKKLRDRIVDQNFEEKIENKRKEVEAATTVSVEKGRIVEEKNTAYQSKKTVYNTLKNAFTTSNFYDRYVQGLEFDPQNQRRTEYSDVIKGRNFMQRIKAPVKEALDRNAHAKRTDHQDSPQYEAMLNAMRTIVDGADNMTAADYLESLRILKESAEAYIRKKKKQWFHWKPSIQRKFRLQYAKGIIEMCDQQMNTIDPNDFVQTTETAARYFTRDEVEVPDEENKEQKEEAYLAQLDGRKDEAIAAYFESSSYKRSVVDAREDYIKELEKAEQNYLNEMGMKDASSEEKRKALDDLEKSLEGYVPEEIDDNFNLEFVSQMMADKSYFAVDEKTGLKQGELYMKRWNTNRAKKSILTIRRDYENLTYNRVTKEANAGYAPSVQELVRLNEARAERQRKIEERRKMAEGREQPGEKIIVQQNDMNRHQNEIIEIREEQRDDIIVEDKKRDRNTNKKTLLEEKD